MLRTPYKPNQTLSSTIKSVMKSSLANLIGVKCAQCSLIYPQDLIQEHLITHIQPKYLMPHQDNSGAKKLSASIHFTDQTLSVNSADFPSLNMSEFPRQQHIRKDIQVPSEFAILTHNPPPLKKDIVSYRGDQKDLSSRLDGFVDHDTVQHMILTQNIYLAQESTQLKPQQQVAVYKSSMLKINTQNSIIRTDKKVYPYESTPEKSTEYQIVPIYEEAKSTSSQEQSASGLLTVNIKKLREPTPRREQINTSSKKSRITPETAIEQHHSSSSSVQEFSPSDNKTSYGYHSRYQNNHSHSNFECQNCHGFYCHHCRSDIPSQYRPVNMEAHLDPTIADFYKKHVHKGQCRECDREAR